MIERCGRPDCVAQAHRSWVRGNEQLMRFLTRVLNGTRPMPGKEGKVVERNLMFARATIRSEEFKQNPTVLDKLKIPKDC
jgi:hypothetical protein